MSNEIQHPLETSKSLAALAAMVFWGAGVSLMDPRTGLGICLCALSIFFTIWIFWEPFCGAKFMRPSTWPKLAIFLLVVQIVVPSYILVAKAAEATTPAVSSANQSGGQAGSITNNGPTYNGPVFADDPSKCPPGYNVIEGLDTWGNGKDGVRTSGNVRLCIVNSKSHDNKGYGYNFESK